MILDTDRILAVAQSIYRQDFRHCFEHEYIQVDRLCGELRISIRSESQFSDDVAQLKLRIYDKHDLVWIEDLHVAPKFRWQGRGSRLAITAETIAQVMGIRRIHLFPLYSARPFWEKMGYSSLAGTARVMSKNVPDGVRLES